MFQDFGAALPLPTQILMAVSAAITSYWWVGATLIMAVVLAWRVWTSTPQGRLGWDQLILRTPVAGTLALKVETARFART